MASSQLTQVVKELRFKQNTPSCRKETIGIPRQEASMHHRLVSVLRQIRNAPARQLDRPEIVDVCRHVKHTGRKCTLDPVAILHLFLDQVLRGNTAINHVVRICGLTFTGPAYCQARARLPLAVSRELLRRVAERIGPATDDAGRWLGPRVFVADGSSFSMPDVPALREHFG